MHRTAPCVRGGPTHCAAARGDSSVRGAQLLTKVAHTWCRAASVPGRCRLRVIGGIPRLNVAVNGGFELWVRAAAQSKQSAQKGVRSVHWPIVVKAYLPEKRPGKSGQWTLVGPNASFLRSAAAAVRPQTVCNGQFLGGTSLWTAHQWIRHPNRIGKSENGPVGMKVGPMFCLFFFFEKERGKKCCRFCPNGTIGAGDALRRRRRSAAQMPRRWWTRRKSFLTLRQCRTTRSPGCSGETTQVMAGFWSGRRGLG